LTKIIDEISSSLAKMTRKFYMENIKGDPKFHIYIGHKLFYDMMAELPKTGHVSSLVFELIHSGTIYGHPIYRVDGAHNFWKIFKL